MSDIFKGYRGDALALLKAHGVRVWSDAEVTTTRGAFTGIILPRSETADDKHIVLKLRNGYNVGLTTGTVVGIKEIGYKEAHYKITEKAFPHDPAKPRQASGDRRADRQPAGLPDGRGHPGVHAR